MHNKSENNVLIANTLYRSAIDEEEKWSKQEHNKHDEIITTSLINEIRALGYDYHYLADITNRENNDIQMLNIILRYIGKFNDEGISAELVGVVGKKGYIEATEVILNNYINSSDENKHKQAAFYDNAIATIKDKRFISTYMELLKNPNNAIKLPRTMIMLGKWRTEEAKFYFLKYLESTKHYLNESTSDLVFIALRALSYYVDKDESIQQAIRNRLDSNDNNVVVATKKAVEKLKKNSGIV